MVTCGTASFFFRLLGLPAEKSVAYFDRIAMTGSSFEAEKAGIIPDKIPMMDATVSPRVMLDSERLITKVSVEAKERRETNTENSTNIAISRATNNAFI